MKSSSPSILLSETFSKVLNYSYTVSILPYSIAICLYPTNPTAETCAQIWGSKCLSTEASLNQVVFVLHRAPKLILRRSLPRQTCRSHCFRPDERLTAAAALRDLTATHSYTPFNWTNSSYTKNPFSPQSLIWNSLAHTAEQSGRPRWVFYPTDIGTKEVKQQLLHQQPTD